jgi:hypothetical protein
VSGASPIQVDLPVEAVVCRAHGEVFRLKWPAGYLGFAFNAFKFATETSQELHDAVDGDTTRLNAAVAEFGPLCRLLTPEQRLEAYREAHKMSADWAERAICANCKRWKLGMRGTFQVRDGVIERHVCFECVAAVPCQSN